MRWSWRADLLPVVLVGLFEGSLIGVIYLAVSSLGPGQNAPLPMVGFWLAAGAGLALARPRPRTDFQATLVPMFVFGAAVAGWLADPAARSALAALGDPTDMLRIHPAGWLLGVAAYRGAVHADTALETDRSTDAVTYAFPLLGVSLLVNLASGDRLAAPAVVGSVICIVAGLLTIGEARLRDLEKANLVSRGGQIWPVISGTLVAVAVVTVPIALILGTVAQAPIVRTGQMTAEAGKEFLTWSWGMIESALTQLMPDWAIPRPSGPLPTRASGAAPVSGGGSPPPGDSSGWTGDPGRVALFVAVVILLLVVYRILARRRAVLLGEFGVSAAPEERQRAPLATRLRSHPRRPAFRRRLPFWRRPTTAAEAYVALLDELSERGALGRRPAETPRHHAHRAAKLGMEATPLALLAADYQLAVYGAAAISESETERAIHRWQRLRRLARRLQRRQEDHE